MDVLPLLFAVACPNLGGIAQEFEKARKLVAHLTTKTAQLRVVCCWL